MQALLEDFFTHVRKQILHVTELRLEKSNLRCSPLTKFIFDFRGFRSHFYFRSPILIHQLTWAAQVLRVWRVWWTVWSGLQQVQNLSWCLWWHILNTITPINGQIFLCGEGVGGFVSEGGERGKEWITSSMTSLGEATRMDIPCVLRFSSTSW